MSESLKSTSSKLIDRKSTQKGNRHQNNKNKAKLNSSSTKLTDYNPDDGNTTNENTSDLVVEIAVRKQNLDSSETKKTSRPSENTINGHENIIVGKTSSEKNNTIESEKRSKGENGITDVDPSKESNQSVTEIRSHKSSSRSYSEEKTHFHENQSEENEAASNEDETASHKSKSQSKFEDELKDVGENTIASIKNLEESEDEEKNVKSSNDSTKDEEVECQRDTDEHVNRVSVVEEQDIFDLESINKKMQDEDIELDIERLFTSDEDNQIEEEPKLVTSQHLDRDRSGCDKEVKKASLQSTPSHMESKSSSVQFPKDIGRTYRRSKTSEFTLTKVERSLDMVDITEDDEEKNTDDDDDDDDQTESKTSIDRKAYYTMHGLFEHQFSTQNYRNNYLQSRMAKYFCKRKMFYALKEQATSKLHEIRAKYERDLEDLGNLYETSEREMETEAEEINRLKVKCKSKSNNLKILFEKLQNIELEYGKTLTFEKTGKTNMYKVVERYMKRQKSQMNLLTKIRLSHFQLRNMIDDATQKLEAIDNLGPGYRIMDYVELKHDFRKLQDRLEEKQFELTKLRASCQHSMQVLAHNREKVAVLDLDIDKYKEEFGSVNQEYCDAREQLSYLQHERDFIRSKTKKLKLDFGLLTNPIMLKDMESAIREISLLRDQVETLKSGYYEKSKKLEAVRKNMEIFTQRKKLPTEETVSPVPSISSKTSLFTKQASLEDAKKLT